MIMESIIIPVSSTFKLEKAVCNHGFFMMAPNRWNPSNKTLVRPLRLPNRNSVMVSISLLCQTLLSITVLDYVHPKFLPSDEVAIKDQVKRMLRLSEEEHIKAFHSIHVWAAEKDFGRLFRNPTLFEDIVKTILLCGCRFGDSLDMAEKLCILQKKLNVKRKRGKRTKSSHESWGNFPSPHELVKLDLKVLKDCNLGLRGGKILQLAKDVVNGKIDMLELEKISDADKLYNSLIGIKGIGDFAVCTVLMCMGFYHKVPIDSETVRHIKQIHEREECEVRNAEKIAKDIYDKYAPFQTLAFWFELVKYYEKRVGMLSRLKECHYKRVAGSFLDSRS